MKHKYILTIALALGAMTAQAGEPNRMIVYPADGPQSGAFMIERVDRIEFATVEGEVAADVKILSTSKAELKVDVIRTEECMSYLLDVIPGVMAHQLETNPAGAASYLRSKGAKSYYEDFSGGTLSGIEDLEAATEYAVITVGADRYGVDCSVRAAYFTTANPDLVGDPRVTAEFVSCTKNDLTVKISANADVSEFYTVIGEKGTLQQQYETFAPMFGFSNIGQMVEMWGQIPRPGNSTDNYTFSGLDPNTDYELYIQPLDAKGQQGPLYILDCHTEKQGGSGASVITITPGDYILNDWGDEKLPSQFFTFTPNDQTWCYRIGVYTEEQYETQKDEIFAYLKSDPEQPTAYWFQYETLETDYQINPNTKVYAMAVGKNADGEWGEVTVLPYTTPAAVSGAPAKSFGKSDTVRARVQKNTRRAFSAPAAVRPVLTH